MKANYSLFFMVLYLLVNFQFLKAQNPKLSHTVVDLQDLRTVDCFIDSLYSIQIRFRFILDEEEYDPESFLSNKIQEIEIVPYFGSLGSTIFPIGSTLYTQENPYFIERIFYRDRYFLLFEKSLTVLLDFSNIPINCNSEDQELLTDVNFSFVTRGSNGFQAIDINDYNALGDVFDLSFFEDSDVNLFTSEIRICCPEENNCQQDYFEPNDLVSMATNIQKNQIVHGFICPESDIDWYSFITHSSFSIFIDDSLFNGIILRENGQVLSNPYINPKDDTIKVMFRVTGKELKYNTYGYKVNVQLLSNFPENGRIGSIFNSEIKRQNKFIDEYEISQEVKISNPFIRGVGKIISPGSDFGMEIFSISGVKVFSKIKFEEASHIIDYLDPGVYVFRITRSGSFCTVRKIVIL